MFSFGVYKVFSEKPQDNNGPGHPKDFSITFINHLKKHYAQHGNVGVACLNPCVEIYNNGGYENGISEICP